MADKAPWAGHRERLRNRAQNEGPDVLRANQLVELILCYAVPRIDVSPVADQLIRRFGSLSGLFNASREALLETPGLTPSMADWLLMTGELLQAYLQVDPASPLRIWRFIDIAEYLGPIWRDVPAPQCWALFTDFNGRLLMKMSLCESNAWADPRYSYDILTNALSIQAKNVILVLFTGARPLALEKWEADYLTSLSRTLHAIEVTLLDCVMVGEAGMASMLARRSAEENDPDSPLSKFYRAYCRGANDIPPVRVDAAGDDAADGKAGRKKRSDFGIQNSKWLALAERVREKLEE